VKETLSTVCEAGHRSERRQVSDKHIHDAVQR